MSEHRRWVFLLVARGWWVACSHQTAFDRMAIDFKMLMREERLRARERHAPPPAAAAALLSEPRSPPPPLPQTDVDWALPSRNDRPEYDAEAHAVDCGVRGIAHIAEWCSAEEEEAMLRCTDGAPAHRWTQLRGRRLQSLGGTPSSSDGGMTREPLPSWVQSVCDELVRCGVFPHDQVLLSRCLPLPLSSFFQLPLASLLPPPRASRPSLCLSPHFLSLSLPLRSPLPLLTTTPLTATPLTASPHRHSPPCHSLRTTCCSTSTGRGKASTRTRTGLSTRRASPSSRSAAARRPLLTPADPALRTASLHRPSCETRRLLPLPGGLRRSRGACGAAAASARPAAVP